MSQVPTDVGDIDQDCVEVQLESLFASHESQMTDISANEEVAASIVRMSGARKFNDADPLEAAAAEKILK